MGLNGTQFISFKEALLEFILSPKIVKNSKKRKNKNKLIGQKSNRSSRFLNVVAEY